MHSESAKAWGPGGCAAHGGSWHGAGLPLGSVICDTPGHPPRQKWNPCCMPCSGRAGRREKERMRVGRGWLGRGTEAGRGESAHREMGACRWRLGRGQWAQVS